MFKFKKKKTKETAMCNTDKNTNDCLTVLEIRAFQDKLKTLESELATHRFTNEPRYNNIIKILYQIWIQNTNEGIYYEYVNGGTYHKYVKSNIAKLILDNKISEPEIELIINNLNLYNKMKKETNEIYEEIKNTRNDIKVLKDKLGIE